MPDKVFELISYGKCHVFFWLNFPMIAMLNVLSFAMAFEIRYFSQIIIKYLNVVHQDCLYIYLLNM